MRSLHRKMKNPRLLGLLLCASTMVFTAPASVAQQATSGSLPNELFGIRLGAIYKFAKNETHNLPVAMVTGVEDNFGAGGSFFFKPEIEEPLLPYMEHRLNSKQKHFFTSHRAYLLPMFPETVKSMHEIDSLPEWNVEALLIEWVSRDDGSTQESSYAWAVETCQTYRLRFGFEPSVIIGPSRIEKQYRVQVRRWGTRVQHRRWGIQEGRLVVCQEHHGRKTQTSRRASQAPKNPLRRAPCLGKSTAKHTEPPGGTAPEEHAI